MQDRPHPGFRDEGENTAMRRRWMRVSFAVVWVLCCCMGANAARIYLVNGEPLTGKILDEDDLTVTLQVGQVKVPLLKSQIVSIEDDKGNVRLLQRPADTPTPVPRPEVPAAPALEPTVAEDPAAPTPALAPVENPVFIEPAEKPLEPAGKVEPLLPVVLPLGKTYLVGAPLLNVRKGPNTDFDKVSALTQGAVVVELRSEGTWKQLRLPDGSIGWASGRYLEAMLDELVACSGERVNLRQGAGLNFKILRKIQKEEILLLLQRKGDWVQLRDSEGLIGWASADYFEKLTGPEAVAPEYSRLAPGALDGILEESLAPADGGKGTSVHLSLSSGNWVHGGRIALIFIASDPDHTDWDGLVQSKDIVRKNHLYGSEIGKRLGIDSEVLGEGNSAQLVILKGFLKDSNWTFEYRLGGGSFSGLRRLIVGQKGDRRGGLYEF